MTELISQNFVQEDIDLSNRKFADSGNGESTASATDTGTGIGDRISNFFSSLFGDDETTARNYTNAASDADALLTVQVDSDERARQAQEIFDRNGAIDVDEHGASTGTAAAATNTNNTANTNRSNLQEGTKIPVVQETLNVGKQEVQRGGARIRSRIVEKPVEEHVRLREEHVVVNRRPVDREITDSDLQNFQPGEMEITERAEVPVVGKQARVVEEVEVSKNVTERDETIRDKVRSTDVDFEEINEPKTQAKSKRARP